MLYATSLPNVPMRENMGELVCCQCGLALGHFCVSRDTSLVRHVHATSLSNVPMTSMRENVGDLVCCVARLCYKFVKRSCEGEYG